MLDTNNLIKEIRANEIILTSGDSNPYDEGFNAGLQMVLEIIKQQDKSVEELLVMKGKLGYIRDGYDDTDKRHFVFREESYTRKINSRGDKIKSKMFYSELDFDDIQSNTDIIKGGQVMVVHEPFFLDDELRERAIRWVEWANSVDPSEYDPFAARAKQN